MRSFRDWPIGWKLPALMICAASATVAACCAALLVSESYRLAEESRAEADSTAEMIATHGEAAAVFEDAAAARSTLAALRLKPDVIHAAIYTRHGRALAEYRARGVGVEETIVARRPIVSGGERAGEATVERRKERMSERMAAYARACLPILAMAVAIAAAFSSVLRRLIALPIGNLAAAAGQISQDGNYSLRVAKSRNDEIGTLTDAFNAMLAQVEERDMALLDHRQHLEEQVQARTTDLLRLNHELRAAKARAEESAPERIEAEGLVAARA